MKCVGDDKLNTKSNKFVCIKNNVKTNIIKHCRGEIKRAIKAIDGFRRKLTIPDHEISVCVEHEVKSKMGTIFLNEKILEEYSVRIYEIDPYKKKYELTIMIKNTYYLELIFILLNIL